MDQARLVDVADPEVEEVTVVAEMEEVVANLLRITMDLDGNGKKFQMTLVELNDLPFEETEGLRYTMDHDASVLDYFQLYMTDCIFKHIVAETNQYAAQFLEVNQEKADYTYYREWTDL